MTTRYSTALSHIILAGTGIYCLIGSQNNPTGFPQISFGVITLNSLLGIWRWGNPSYGPDSSRLYHFTSFLQDILALPCIVTTIWLTNGYMRELSYAHSLASVIPLINYICDDYDSYRNYDLVDFILGVNCISLGVVSLNHQNYFGVATSISYAFSHFIVKNDNETYFNVTSQDFYNYTMCFFAVFALKAVLE